MFQILLVKLQNVGAIFLDYNSNIAPIVGDKILLSEDLYFEVSDRFLSKLNKDRIVCYGTTKVIA